MPRDVQHVGDLHNAAASDAAKIRPIAPIISFASCLRGGDEFQQFLVLQPFAGPDRS
ncbi:hypothetical protein AKJ09_07222 [Labilithrix luteola]|uniref:Uncharacterized protein n=1 Tax=Labilithrix luteola TaxID=1391654 RepID=A0A0K1Q498_9BACT|nr:hypothetical protein AKJ09_07222 [Labilithrix luteola]